MAEFELIKRILIKDDKPPSNKFEFTIPLEDYKPNIFEKYYNDNYFSNGRQTIHEYLNGVDENGRCVNHNIVNNKKCYFCSEYDRDLVVCILGTNIKKTWRQFETRIDMRGINIISKD